jgi:hypothetical protein
LGINRKWMDRHRRRSFQIESGYVDPSIQRRRGNGDWGLGIGDWGSGQDDKVSLSSVVRRPLSGVRGG